MEPAAILGSLRIPAAAAASAPALFRALVNRTLEATLEGGEPGSVQLRLPDGRAVQAQGSLPFPAGSVLTLKALPLPGGGGVHLQVIQATPPPAPPLLAPLARGEAAPLMARLAAPTEALGPLALLLRHLVQAGPAAPEDPGTWLGWMKGAMGALADPAASPAEAAFHRLQAHEGTAWFELPLPWAAGSEPLRLWVEGDPEPAACPGEAVQRVLLSVPFSALGEVRLGLEQRTAGLRVRIWVACPEVLDAGRAALEAELEGLGRPVDLQILPLPQGAEDLRALAGATHLQALG